MTGRSLHDALASGASPRPGRDPRWGWVLVAAGGFVAASQSLYGSPDSVLTVAAALSGVAAAVGGAHLLRRGWPVLSPRWRHMPLMLCALAAVAFGFGALTQTENASGPLLVGTEMERAVAAAGSLRADLSDLDRRLPPPEVTDAEVLVEREYLTTLVETLTRRAASRTGGWPAPAREAAAALGEAEAAASRWIEARVAYAEQPSDGRLAALELAESSYRTTRQSALDAVDRLERSLQITGRP